MELTCIMTSMERSSVYHLMQDDSKYSKRLMSKVHAANIKKSETIENYLNDLVYLNACKLNHKIPRQIVCLDEKYLRHCLEMIHVSAAKSASCNISLHTSSLEMGIPLNGFTFPVAQNIDPFGAAGCSVKSSLPSEKVNYSSPGHWIVGSINGSKSMKNILKSPLFQRLRVPGDDKYNYDFNFLNSGIDSNTCSPQKLQKDFVVIEESIYKPAICSRYDSMSSTNASEDRLSDPWAIFSHGLLQCTMTDGKPHYVFSVDEQREVYEADLLSTESAANGDLEWIYLFNIANGSQQKGKAASTQALVQAGKMEVSAYCTLCPVNSKILETKFVLYGREKNSMDDSQPLSQSLQRGRGLSKKVASTFTSNFSVRKRTNYGVWRTSPTMDSCPWSPATVVTQNVGATLGMTDALEKQSQPYCELAAVIIRKHIIARSQEVDETEGWGVNILKRVSCKETNDCQYPIVSLKSQWRCKDGYCSTTDIIIPAGYHSRPGTGDGVPSSLVERWETGGQCDCGGWDLGCPLSVLSIKPNKHAVLAPISITNQHEWDSLDAVLKGTEKHPPRMKMVNISSDQYYLSFQSSLTALQCFAIAVATLHCQNTSLQSKIVQELERGSLEVAEWI